MSRKRYKFSRNHAATATAAPRAGAGFASFTAPATKPAGNLAGFSPDLTEFPPVPASPRVRELTPGEVRTMYGPARSLGGSEDLRVAMDSALEESGVYGLMAHTLDLGQGVFPQFMGYGALQNISQNGLIRACIGTVADDMTREWIKLQREGAASTVGTTEEGRA